MARKITMNMLKQQGACRDQRKLFYNRFRNETTVTLAKCIKYAEVFDWRFGKLFLKGKARVWYLRQIYIQKQAWIARNERIDRIVIHRSGSYPYHQSKMVFLRAMATLFYKAYNGKL